MDWVPLLLVIIGAVAGGLAVLWWDLKYWGGRLQTAVQYQRQLKKQMQAAQTQLARQARQLRQQTQQIAQQQYRNNELTVQLAQETAAHQTAVSDLQVVRDNLQRVNDHADNLQQDNDAWTEKYRAAEEALAIDRAQMGQVMGELTAVQSENEHIRQTVLTVSNKMKQFGALQEQARALQEQARHQETLLTRLREEKLAVTTALRHAEGQVRTSNETARQQQVSIADLRRELREQKEAGQTTQTRLEESRQQVREQQTTIASWQQQQQAQAAALQEAKHTGHKLQAKVTQMQQKLVQADEVRRRLTAVNQELAAAKVEIETLQNQLRDHTYMQKAILQQDESLTLINGIGPKYAQRLRDAGVSSLTQLANSSADDLRQRLKLQTWQGRHIDGWIAEAQELVTSFSTKNNAIPSR